MAVVTSGDKNLYVAAAKGEGDAAVMMSNDSDRTIPLVCDFQGRAVVDCRITDNDRTDKSVPLPAELPPRSFVVVILKQHFVHRSGFAVAGCRQRADASPQSPAWS